MVYLLRDESGSAAGRTAIWIIIIVVVAVLLILLWIFVIIPYASGSLFPSNTISCTTAPGMVTGVTAVASGNTAKVSWTATSNTDSYVLYIGITSGFTTALAQRTISVVGTSIAVENLEPLTYYLRVSAINTCGASAPSKAIPVVITTFPSKFKLCKKNNPLYCLLLQQNGAEARISTVCPTGECDLQYLNLQSIASYNDNTLCLLEDNPGGVVIESLLISGACSGTAVWNMNLNTGIISTPDGLCLGADAIAESTVYNSTCTALSNQADPRYVWVLQPE